MSELNDIRGRTLKFANSSS